MFNDFPQEHVFLQIYFKFHCIVPISSQCPTRKLFPGCIETLSEYHKGSKMEARVKTNVGNKTKITLKGTLRPW